MFLFHTQDLCSLTETVRVVGSGLRMKQSVIGVKNPLLMCLDLKPSTMLLKEWSSSPAALNINLIY